MEEFFASIWSIRDEPNWKFRCPRSIEESATFVEVYMDIVRGLFKVADYDGPVIGGEVQIETIAPPALQ